MTPVFGKQMKKHRLPALAGAIGIGMGIYAITNPYVIIHLLHDPAVLRSNLENTSAMYGVRSAGGAVWNAAMLMVAGMSPVLAAGGVVGVVGLAVRRLRKRKETGGCPRRGSGGGMLLALVAIVVMIPYVALAAGKPGEYGRFAGAGCGYSDGGSDGDRGVWRTREAGAGDAAAGIDVVFGTNYTAGFGRDAGPDSSRMLAAGYLRALPGDRLAIAAEPAPIACRRWTCSDGTCC